jgi:heat shock protein HtpX
VGQTSSGRAGRLRRVPYHPPLVQQPPTSPSALTVVSAAGTLAGLVLALPFAILLGPVVGLVVLVVMAVAVALVCWLAAGPVILRLVGGAAPSLTTAGPARLANLVESLAVAVGVPEPALRVVDDPAPNALVTGLDPRRATVVVTSGLLERLDRLALEAVLAQQLSIIRAGATHRRDVAVAVLGTAGMVVPPLGRLAASAAAAERDADVAAVGVTRYPPGLLSALGAVAAGPQVQASPVLAPMWFAPPGAADELALRLETMRELV